MRKSPYARKDNFWSQQRVEKQMTIREIAEIIELPEKQVGAYFTGMLMPKDPTIRALCELFDVEYPKGKTEFHRAHHNWRAEHGASVKYSAKGKPRTKRRTEITSAEDILETLYSVLSCSEFIDIYNVLRGEADASVNPMKILYQKVDFDTYTAITDLISNTKKGETE